MELQNMGCREERRRGHPALVVIRRNRLGDMICTLPLLEALRREFPQAHLAVACEAAGAPIAQACAAVDETIVLATGGLRWWTLWKNARRLRRFDWVIAAKGGFDRRLARLAKWTGAARRIGFDREPSAFYTDPVAPPENPQEHQVETLLKLLAPLGISASFSTHPILALPDRARALAEKILSAPPFSTSTRFVLINISSTSRLRFQPADFLELTRRLLAATDFAIGFVAAPADQPQARELAARARSARVSAVATPGPLELAALLERTLLFLTPEGGAAHLAAATRTATVVLWSEGPFDKWRSRGEKQVFVQAGLTEPIVPVDRVWAAMEPLLAIQSPAPKPALEER
jgi:ADP-heptose:LPS heptosyltransferase